MGIGYLPKRIYIGLNVFALRVCLESRIVVLPDYCVEGPRLSDALTSDLQGYLEDPTTFVADNASLEIEAEYPNCRVLPSSKLTVNKTSIDSGEVSSLSATFLVSGRKQEEFELLIFCVAGTVGIFLFGTRFR